MPIKLFRKVRLANNVLMNKIKSCFWKFLVFLVCIFLFSNSLYSNIDVSNNLSENIKSENKVVDFDLSEDTTNYFVAIGNVTCFKEGTDEEDTAREGRCICHLQYRGDDCGIPLSIYNSLKKFYKPIKLSRRKTPRRVINAFNFNHEIDLLEARLNDLSDVVDVFVICESNFTAFGEPKPLILLQQMRENPNIQKFNNKIMRIELTKLPSLGKNSGWFIDRYIRVYMGYKSVPNIKNKREDDLVILNDADEIPNRDVLVFLKLYDGYPIPVKLNMKWSIFGFFWRKKMEGILDIIFGGESDMTSMGSVTTLGMLEEVFDGNIFMMRYIQNSESEVPEILKSFSLYKKKVNHPLGWWAVGTRENPAGFHCSWCFEPEGIRIKLLSAHKDDKPRWGDFPEKTDLNYLATLRETGTWFDGTKPLMQSYESNEGDKYAPKYILDNREKFRYLLVPPSRSE